MKNNNDESKLNSNETNLENKVEDNTNKNNKPEKQKEQILSQVTRGDLILFKEDILKLIKELKKELNNKITDRLEECNNLLETSNKKLYDYETDKNTFLKNVTFVEEKNEILSKINELKLNLKNEINVHSLHIDKCQRDISNMGFKYDKIVTSNLKIPGLVGPMCRFGNLKDYILSNRREISTINSNISVTKDDLKNTKKNLAEFREEFAKFEKLNEPAYQAYANLKAEQVESKFKNEFETIGQRVTEVRIENATYAQNFIEREEELKDYLKKIEELKKSFNEDYKKVVEKVNQISSYTISKLEKSISESINIKKSVLELSNIFAKQKRSYGDDNLNENKREVILSFGNMVNNLIKDLMNDKKKVIAKNISPIMKESNKKEYIDAKPYMLSSKSKKKLIDESNQKSAKKINEFITEKKVDKQKVFLKRKTVAISETLKNVYLNDFIYNDNKNINDLGSLVSPQKKTNNINERGSLNNEVKMSSLRNSAKNNNIFKRKNSENINNIKNQKSESINYTKKISENINYNNNNKLLTENISNITNGIENANKVIMNNNTDNTNIKNISVITDLDSNNFNNLKGSSNNFEKNNFNTKITYDNNYIRKESKNEEKKIILHKSNYDENKIVSDVKINISSTIIQPIHSNNNNNKKEVDSSTNTTDRVLSRNFKDKNIKSKILNKENTKEQNVLFLKDRKSEKSKEKKISLTENIHNKSGNSNFKKSINSNNNMPVALSLKSGFFEEKKKDNDFNDSIKKRPYSKMDNVNRKKIFKKTEKKVHYNINGLPKNMSIERSFNRDNNKEIFYDKKIENEINYVKDKDIIDMPLLSNQAKFEVSREKGDVERKIIELEYFTKKKFDELVKEIKNFIPIHFNSYVKDYN
jgi:hypothetical protein